MAGRKMRYGEPTVPMRIPKSMVSHVEKMLKEREVITTEWVESLLPPDAEKLVQRLADVIALPLGSMNEAVIALLQSEIDGGGDDKRIKRLKAFADMFNSVDMKAHRDAAAQITRGMLIETIDKQGVKDVH